MLAYSKASREPLTLGVWLSSVACCPSVFMGVEDLVLVMFRRSREPQL